MDINLTTFLYLFLRLSPFILICFFTLASIFNTDLRGIVLLSGLILALGVGILISKIIPKIEVNSEGVMCEILSFGKSELSNIPLNQIILGYTFTYLMTTILIRNSKDDSMNYVSANWPTITFFSILIFMELYINSNAFDFIKNYIDPSRIIKYCYDWKTSVMSYLIGIGIGIGWAFLIDSTNSPDLQYFPKYDNDEKCDRSSEKTFTCQIYKGGELYTKAKSSQ
jgi:hypothetical protein